MYIVARMTNKVVVLLGALMPNFTEIRVLNHARNVEISKIVVEDKNTNEDGEVVKSKRLVLVKIQLKEDAIGQKLVEAVQKEVKKE